MTVGKNDSGFTLIELLVSMAILGILSTLGLGTFRSSQIKSRDAIRKSDLGSIQKALEMYQSDNGVYPSSNSSGQIVIASIPLDIPLDWSGRVQFIDPDQTKGTVYMQELPNDPHVSPSYCYISIGSAYKLYAKLENTNDLQRLPVNVSCNSVDYNYGVSSSNTKP